MPVATIAGSGIESAPWLEYEALHQLMMHAQLNLAFSLAGGRTRLHCRRQDPPWKVVRAFPNAAGESLVHLNNVSGGVFGGDCLRLRRFSIEGRRVDPIGSATAGT